MKDSVIRGFYECYGDAPGAQCYFAPGRVNLIGEHTDYNGGHVFPCALTLGTYLMVKKRADRRLRFASMNFPESGITESSLEDFRPGADDSWTAYMKGVMWAFAARGLTMDAGMDIMVGGDLPAGAGLSSSASLEVVTGVMLRDQYRLQVSQQDIALLGQKCENDYVGVNCGIMDQFASAMGKRDHAIYLDTMTLEYEYVPLAMEGKKLVVTNTNRKHALNDSAYNDRRRECAAALAVLQQYAEIDALGDLEPAAFMELQSHIADPIARKRAQHAVMENQRTKDAVAVLRKHDLEAFGQLMNASHISLRDDYEVSCPELDLLAESAWTIPGVLGSRMTGGGFGGCTVSIVEDGALTNYQEVVGRKYRDAFGYDCDFIIVEAGDGPGKEII